MTGYKQDFALWAKRQAQLLREKRFHELDLENLAEEVDSIYGHMETELEWHVGPLLAHLIRWQAFEGLRCDNWRSVMSGHRIWIDGVLEDCPSLKSEMPELIEHLWLSAILDAHKTTGLFFDLMPKRCPWTVEEVLDVGFVPK